MNSKVQQWILDGRDTGTSSKAIVAFMEGHPVDNGSYPRDPDDLGRCIRLLEIAPEYRTLLKSMRVVSPEWARLVEHWDELEALYRKELPFGTSPQCFDLMYFLTTGKAFPRKPKVTSEKEQQIIETRRAEAEIREERERQERLIQARYGSAWPEQISDYWL